VEPHEEFEGLRGNLWIEDADIHWSPAETGHRVQVELTGAPDDCRLVISAPDRPWPSGQISLIWKGVRVRGLDLYGPAHPYRGKKVATPHRQFFTASGEPRPEAVDLGAEGIESLGDALRWFLDWCGIEWRFRWQDPPTQPPMAGTKQTRAMRKARANRKRR